MGCRSDERHFYPRFCLGNSTKRRDYQASIDAWLPRSSIDPMPAHVNLCAVRGDHISVSRQKTADSDKIVHQPREGDSFPYRAGIDSKA